MPHLEKRAPAGSFKEPDKDQKFLVKFRPASVEELKLVGDDKPDGYIAGWASTQDMDLYGHRVMSNAFSESILKRGLGGPKGIKLLINHDWRKIAGLITVLEYRGGNLWMEAQLGLKISYAADMYEAAKINGPLNFSVGFQLLEYKVEGNEKDGEWLRIIKGDLNEVSIVPFPGNEEATMEYIKNGEGANKPTVAQFEKWLVQTGLAKSRREANTIVQEIKVKSSLLKDEEDLGDDSTLTEIPPVLAAETLTKAHELVMSLKALLTPKN